ncbi:MAG: APC family permease [Candidatus Hydrogenedentes bacterium]|nr:APC family permease [Candidatus Hydrogenedentota bacterium]
MDNHSETAEHTPHLHRQFGLLQSTALNMANMVGVGPFITIPLLMSAMGEGGGPQAMLGWFFAALICIPDGMVWSELGAAFPKSGGPYVYLREGFGAHKLGRLMAFLFLWQFLLSGPLEIASGYIGFGKYMRYFWPDLSEGQMIAIAMTLGVVNIAFLYRRIRTLSTLTVLLWCGTIATVATAIIAGLPHFNPRIAFDFPEGAFDISSANATGLGAAMLIGIYDYLGYYNVCHIGDEVREPGKTMPRAIMISVIVVAGIYFVMNLSLIGVVSWREFVPASEHPNADFVFSTYMERLMGPTVAIIFTIMVLWTTYASVFALLLGYSRIPYAAAQDGTFFRIFGKLHPSKDFPHISLLFIGGIAILACLLDLGTVISTLVTVRILVQFIGQIAAVMLLRKAKPELPRPYRIWLYPLPCFIALVGWIFVIVTAEQKIQLFSILALAIGIVAYMVWARTTKRWPFEMENSHSA